jgi:hypothetical protein
MRPWRFGSDRHHHRVHAYDTVHPIPSLISIRRSDCVTDSQSALPLTVWSGLPDTARALVNSSKTAKLCPPLLLHSYTIRYVIESV